MLITRNALSFEVEPGIAINDGEGYWNDVNQGLWEPETFAIFQHFLSKDHSYLDIGAWVGPTVLFGAQLARTCFAFEPDPIAFAALQKNLSHNPQINNVNVQPVAISDITGSVQIGSRGPKGSSMSSLLWSQDCWTVPSFTLKDYVQQNNINDCSFIKMDIEGGEANALYASKEFFRDYHPSLFVSLHIPWITDKQDYFEKLIETFSVYKYIYLSNKDPFNLKDLPGLNGFQSIIITDEL